MYRSGDQSLPQDVNQTVATMASIPAGSYVFVAKTTLVSSTGSDAANVVCTLDAGGTVDTSELRMVQLAVGARGTVEMQLVTTFASTGTAVVRCQTDAAFSISARHTSIVAIKVDTVTRTAVTA